MEPALLSTPAAEHFLPSPCGSLVPTLGTSGFGRRAQAAFNEALRLHVAGRIEEAMQSYERALLLNPAHLEALNNLGVALLAQGRAEEAAARYRQALLLSPRYTDAHNNLAVALAAQGRFLEASISYERALRLNPAHAGVHYNLGLALAALGRTGEAEAHYRRALALKPDYAEAHNNLGNLLAARNRAEEAIAHYRKAIAVDPGNAEAHNNLGNIFRDRGGFEEALAHYDRAIEIQPGNAEAHYHRAELKTFRASDAEMGALQRLTAAQADSPFLHFALAKALEDTGDYRRALAGLHIGNDLKRRQVRYDEPAVAEVFQRIAAVFDKNLCDRFEGAGDPSEVPVFVLGMPRSGSTLIEQILASHPRVHGGGELVDLESAIRDFTFPDAIPRLDAGKLRRIGRTYSEGLACAATGRTRIVNKLPRNFLYIGLIRMILPNAKIIHTVRDPIDTCMSCYSKLFTSGQHFSYDMVELGRYYRYYEQLMAHWRAVLPEEAMLEVRYEDVIDDLEGQARRMIRYCGLPWDERCVSYHKTRRSVLTASAVQVRKPLFRSSLQRWRKFEFGIGPLLDALASEL